MEEGGDSDHKNADSKHPPHPLSFFFMARLWMLIIIPSALTFSSLPATASTTPLSSISMLATTTTPIPATTITTSDPRIIPSPPAMVASLCSSIPLESPTKVYPDWEVIGQGASGLAYRAPSCIGLGAEGKDWVIKVGEGEAAGEALENECRLLQILKSRGVGGTPGVATIERCRGLCRSSIQEGGRGKEKRRTVIAMYPWFEGEQIDRARGETAGTFAKLLLVDVGVKGGVLLTDVQVLVQGGDDSSSSSMIQLIDLTEGMEIDQASPATVRAFVTEVISLIEASPKEHRIAAQALIDGLKSIKKDDDAGVIIPSSLAEALIEVPLNYAPPEMLKEIAEEVMRLR